MKWVKQSSFFYIVIGIVLLLPVILPYFKPGYFPSHDGEWAVVRAGEMFREVRDMQFPPRYSAALNFGYGYPLFNFAYPFPYYLATILHVVHIGFVDSIKVIFASSVIGSFLGMFFLSLYFWKSRKAALASALLYVYLPYRFVDLYVRGSIGESLAFSFYPFLLLSLLFIASKKTRNVGIVCTAILIPMLATTHNISAVFFGIIFIVYIMALLIAHKSKDAMYSLLAVGWGGLLSAYFIVPALIEKANIKLSRTPIADRNLYFVTVGKLTIPTWGYGTPTDSNPFTYQIGLPQLAAFIVSLFAWNKVKNFEKTIFVSYLVLIVIFICMMFPFSSSLWTLPLLSEINYPWTLLLPIGFLICFIVGAIGRLKIGGNLLLALAAISIVMYIPYVKPITVNNFSDDYYITNEATTTSSNELMPLWVKKIPTQHFDKKIVSTGPITDERVQSNKISFQAILDTSEKLSINQIYYPGWRAYNNGVEQEIMYKNAEGIMTINLPSGKNNVVFAFTETPLRFTSNIVSLIAGIGVVGFLVVILWKNLHTKGRIK